MYTGVCVYVNVSGCECIGVYRSVPVCLCENACVYVCVYECVVCECVQVCVCVCVCMLVHLGVSV